MTDHTCAPRWPLLLAGWVGVVVLLSCVPAYLVLASDRFDWSRSVADIPSVQLTVLLAAAGLVWLLLVPLVGATSRGATSLQRCVLAFVLVLGTLMRLSLVSTEPALEDDSYRFLWEGALVARGLSPYAGSPLDVLRAAADSRLGKLAAEAGPVLDRVNHPWLASTYPPIAQAAFTFSHLLSPWDLGMWRMVCIGFDAAAMALLLVLLAEARRPLLWSSLYWLSPLVIKETANSGHFDSLPVALTLAALWLAARKRPLASVVVLALATGVKFWPAALLPLLLRPMMHRPRQLVAALFLFAGLVALWTLPVWMAEHSGLAAYARGWSTNSALTPLVQAAVGVLVPANIAPLLTRVIMGCAVAAVAIWISRRPIAMPEDLVQRAAIVVAAIVLLAPAQFPWYAIWLMPFLAFVPRRALLSIPVAISLYYLSFHFAAEGTYATYSYVVVWAEWLPIWLLLAHGYFSSEENSRRLQPK